MKKVWTGWDCKTAWRKKYCLECWAQITVISSSKTSNSLVTHDVLYGWILKLFKSFIKDWWLKISTLSNIMCDTKLGGLSEKWQGKATIQRDWRNRPRAVQQRQIYVLYLGQGMSLQAADWLDSWQLCRPCGLPSTGGWAWVSSASLQQKVNDILHCISKSRCRR